MTAKEVMGISPIVPVIALDSVEDALPLAEALLEGGISIMEITLRTKVGLQAIEAISNTIPQMHVGAGTVLNTHDFKQAADHGAQFVFSPGISEALMHTSKELDIVLIPGVATASEIMLAKNNGFDHCKLFRATISGGVEALKAFKGPFSSMSFCPTGGVNIKNLNDFLSLSNVLCVGGSWIVPKTAIQKKNFQEITKLCKEAMNLIQSNKVGA